MQIDHTPADIILVDSFERQPIGRPWVTLAIDIATRMVTGYYTSLDAPSRLSVALCLTQAVAPKAELLTELACNIPWPAQGKPQSIHVDNGRDFRSRAFRSACAEWGIDLVYRPPGSPHFGGHIERLIGTMMGAVHLLPGTTQSSIAAKGDYDAEGMATMTLREFDRWVCSGNLPLQQQHSFKSWLHARCQMGGALRANDGRHTLRDGSLSGEFPAERTAQGQA